jgi:hypothetical protein
MSVVGFIIEVSRKEKLMLTICVFCETTYASDVLICVECHDYKGMMPLADAMATYDFIQDPNADN